ncbi:MAG: hypothetical protein ACRDF7_03410 [Candidatus Limnocylindrales bacterium]
MNVFITDLRNQPGELAKVTEAIAAKGIDITAFGAVATGTTGTVALVTNDEAGTRRALNEAHIKTHEVELVTAPVPNGAGSLADVSRRLANLGINVEAAFPTRTPDGQWAIAFATSDPAKARSMLGERVAVGASH